MTYKEMLIEHLNRLENLMHKITAAEYDFETNERKRTIINIDTNDATVLSHAIMHYHGEVAKELREIGRMKEGGEYAENH